MPAALPLQGRRFGRLLVVERDGSTPGGFVAWACRCDCGARTVVRSTYLASGHTTSCGCAAPEKHGQWGTPEYTAWSGARGRCMNEKDSSYRHYGGRGITMCAQWTSSFPAFLADMGPRPSPGHSLDRMNNDGNYEPGNCRWATGSEQHANRRCTSAPCRKEREAMLGEIASLKRELARVAPVR